MADDANNNPTPFDVGTIKNLVALMSRHDLSEIDLSIGDQRIRLRRGVGGSVAPVAMPMATIPTVMPASMPVPSSPASTAKEKSGPALIEIKSETPGTFYAKPDPEKPPYVTVGTRVKPETVICTIEAMKIFNEVQAGCAGVIAEILVENGKPVEWGQVLFRVNPAG